MFPNRVVAWATDFPPIPCYETGVVDLIKIQAGIEKTGFALEFVIAEAFRNRGWTTISNKYYVDDVAGSVREIDLIAYKVGHIEGRRIYSAAIVSCKKSEQNAWTLIAKDVHKSDPNKNWYPLHNWTNDPVLRFSLEQKSWQPNYITAAKEERFFEMLLEPQFDIFAFQEVRKANGAPKDDRSIFSAVSSLMKAQGYEISNREFRSKERPRRKYKSFYNFILMSIVDCDLIRYHLSYVGESGKIQFEGEEISAEKYIGSYIINNEEVTARVNFVRADVIEAHILALDQLHEFNVKFCSTKIDEYFDEPFKTLASTNVLIDKFRSSVYWPIHWKLKHLGEAINAKDISIWNPEEADYVEVELPVDPQIIEVLNGDEDLLARVSKGLKEVYKYDGDVRFNLPFDDDIPF